VALAEYARHGDPAGRDVRRLYRLTLRSIPALDVRRPAVAAQLGLPDRDALSDRTRTRAAATRVRNARICAALVVPSMAFLDRPDRFNVVIFCDAVDHLERVLTDPREVGCVDVQPSLSGGVATRDS